MKNQIPTINDHRWFIWTIVFLIASGVSLVSYIMISEINQDTANADFTVVQHPK